MREIRPRKTAGFTLIELLASMVLTAILMVAVSRITSSALRDWRQLESVAGASSSTTMLAQQIRRDLINARGLAIDASGFTIHGFTDPEGRASRVRYERVARSGAGVLVRADGTTRESVWVGVSAFTLEPLSMPGDASAVPVGQRGGLPPVPGSSRFTLVDHNGVVRIRETVIHDES